MFNSLKNKLKDALNSLTKAISKEEAVTTQEQPAAEAASETTEQRTPEPRTLEPPQEQPKRPTHTKPETPAHEPREPERTRTPEAARETRKAPVRTKETPAPSTQEHAEPEEAPVQETIPTGTTVPEEQPKKGWFTKLSEQLTTIQLSDKKFEELFWELELALLENNVAVSVIEKIKDDLRQELTTGRTARGNLEERVLRRLEQSLRDVLAQETQDLIASTEEHQPYVIVAVGVNGSGKTTTLAKLARHFQKHKKTVVLAACDTFRAAAIQQLEEHAKRLSVPIIKQDYGADPAAVAFDAIAHARARHLDVVLIDTAGRLHSNTNLMDELRKVVRVAKPHHVLFIGEAVTGNDCVEQAQQFGRAVPIDGIILTKADVDEKGGAAVSLRYVTGKPILFLGTGQTYDDLKPFTPEDVLRNVLPVTQRTTTRSS